MQFFYIISNSFAGRDCRVFHDCIKHVESVTFLTRSYCCKLVDYDSRISQGNVVTVLRRGGHNYKGLQHVSSRCYKSNLIKTSHSSSEINLRTCLNTVYFSIFVFVERSGREGACFLKGQHLRKCVARFVCDCDS